MLQALDGSSGADQRRQTGDGLSDERTGVDQRALTGIRANSSVRHVDGPTDAIPSVDQTGDEQTPQTETGRRPPTGDGTPAGVVDEQRVSTNTTGREHGQTEVLRPRLRQDQWRRANVQQANRQTLVPSGAGQCTVGERANVASDSRCTWRANSGLDLTRTQRRCLDIGVKRSQPSADQHYMIGGVVEWVLAAQAQAVRPTRLAQADEKHHGVVAQTLCVVVQYALLQFPLQTG